MYTLPANKLGSRENVSPHLSPDGHIQTSQLPRNAQGVFMSEASNLPTLSNMAFENMRIWTTRKESLTIQEHSGAFKSEMIDANKAFGHGVGVDKSLSVEQMATLELSLKEF